LLEASTPFREDALDPEHFEKAAELGRVLVTNDQPFVDTAHQWLEKGRRFKGMVGHLASGPL
jgi:predicted nuclease of predicted toxin-antitoxin system